MNDSREIQNYSSHLSSKIINIQDYTSLTEVSLKELRNRNRETESAIQAVKSRINYMKSREEKTVKKIINARRRLSSLDEIKQKNKEFRQQSIEVHNLEYKGKKRLEDSLEKKYEHNKLIKDHLKYNKQIVMVLLNQKVQEEVKEFKDKQNLILAATQVNRESMIENNMEKANKVRTGHVNAHERRKMYFLDKLKQFKDFKERKLEEEVRERSRQENMILEMEEKEKILLERLSVSEKFRLKCQEEFEDAKRKYKSFYEVSRGINRDGDSSLNDSKAEIFIS